MSCFLIELCGILLVLFFVTGVGAATANQCFNEVLMNVIDDFRPTRRDSFGVLWLSVPQPPGRGPVPVRGSLGTGRT